MHSTRGDVPIGLMTSRWSERLGLLLVVTSKTRHEDVVPTRRPTRRKSVAAVDNSPNALILT